MTSKYYAPDVSGWRFVTNSDAPTAEAAEAEYRATVTLILTRRGQDVPPFDVLVAPFAVSGDPEITFAVYRRE
jgi:hypothetical protein